uniref:Coiled-coil domain-containing protein 14 n=1 Tax=Anthurium amnicola TaxID=1678845 RepID=A0A1D1XHZ9_9ARAE
MTNLQAEDFLSKMEDQGNDALTFKPRVKAIMRLGSDSFCVRSGGGMLSQQLVEMKEESMSILKDFIIKHNIPNDIPDEPAEGMSEEESEAVNNPPKKSKKHR